MDTAFSGGAKPLEGGSMTENQLDDYEEGALTGFVMTDKKWWQFWMPKKYHGNIGIYTKIGNMMQVNLNGGMIFIYKEDETITYTR